MLVLSRKLGEEIVIPQLGLTFTILDVRGDRVRVGVAAPTDVRVFRREVWDRIQRSDSSEESSVEGAVPNGAG